MSKPPSTLALVRSTVREHLAGSPAFRQLPPDQRREIAHDLVRISTYLTVPEGMPANTIARTVVVFDQLIEAVDFPEFVESLIRGVFDAIIDSSIEQMRAFGKMLKEVGNTVDAFLKAQVSDDDARQSLAATYPEYFELDTRRHLCVRADADRRQAAKRLSRLVLNGDLRSLDSRELDTKLVPAARSRMAASRQQLLASMVLMGINRIVVTNGAVKPRR